MTPERISVLLPVRNGEKYLPAALESLAAQSHRHFECIAVNDGSTDSTGGILDAFAKRDPRFKPFHRPPEGLVKALNFGLERCRGDLVARMDADDISLPERLKRQQAWLRSHPQIAAAGTLVKIIPRPRKSSGMRYYEDWINSLVEPEDIAREIYVESPLPHPSAMIRKSVLIRLGGWRDFEGPEDYDLWLRMHNAGLKMGKVPCVLLEWRDAPERASRTQARYSLDAFINLKAYHLARDKRLSPGRVQIWGAGKTGKTYAKALKAQGLRVCRFIDINPRKIGRSAQGAPVIAPDELGDHPRDFIIGAVGGRGARGAREEIRAALVNMGYRETEHFLFVA